MISTAKARSAIFLDLFFLPSLFFFSPSPLLPLPHFLKYIPSNLSQNIPINKKFLGLLRVRRFDSSSNQLSFLRTSFFASLLRVPSPHLILSYDSHLITREDRYESWYGMMVWAFGKDTDTSIFRDSKCHLCANMYEGTQTSKWKSLCWNLASLPWWIL